MSPAELLRLLTTATEQSASAGVQRSVARTADVDFRAYPASWVEPGRPERKIEPRLQPLNPHRLSTVAQHGISGTIPRVARAG